MLIVNCARFLGSAYFILIQFNKHSNLKMHVNNKYNLNINVKLTYYICLFLSEHDLLAARDGCA
jgi:hypothetical protein